MRAKIGNGGDVRGGERGDVRGGEGGDVRGGKRRGGEGGDSVTWWYSGSYADLGWSSG